MENGPVPASASSLVHSPANCQVIPGPWVRKRAYRARGSAFFRQSPIAWSAFFDPGKVRLRIESFRGQHHKGLEYRLSGAERRLLLTLLNHAEGRLRGLPGAATARWTADQTGMDPGNASRILSRLGVCGIVVNLSGGRSMDLAINGDLGSWDMDRLHQLRRDRSRQLSADVRGV